MPKIISKADLNVGTELTINTTTREITLNVAGNLVAKDGVTWQAFYSKLIQLWTTDTYNEFPFPLYTIDALSGQFSIGFDGTRYNTWKFAGNSRLYLRDGGWDEWVPTTPGADGTSATGSLGRQYVGIVSLGTVSSGAQLYYQTTNGGAATDFTYTDAANIGVQVYGNATVDASTTTFDTRTYFKGYVREYQKSYKDSILADTGKSATGAYLVNLLLDNRDDLDIVAADGTVDGAAAPWNRISIRYFSSAFSKDIDDTTGSNPRNFGIVVDVGTHSGIDGSTTAGGSVLTSATGGILTTGNPYAGGTLKIHTGTNKGTYTISGNPTATQVTITGTFANAVSDQDFTIYPATTLTDGASGSVTLKQIYTKIQRQLRQSGNINDVSGGSTVTGKTASLLLNFVGSRLDAGTYAPTNPAGGGSGVLIEGIASADVNSVKFYDNSAVAREYPYQSAATINFSSNLVTGGGGYYVLYYTDLSGSNDWSTADAVKVSKIGGGFVEGTISGSSVSFNYDYTNETAGGLRTGGTDTAVTLVAGNPGYAKPVVVQLPAAQGLTASKSIVITATAETDRAYQ